MEKGFEAVKTPHRSTVVDCIEDRLRQIQAKKESYLRTLPPEMRVNTTGIKDVTTFDVRLRYLDEACQLLRMYDGTISANRRAIEYLQAYLDQMDASRAELIDLYGQDDLQDMDNVRADIIAILTAYSA